MFFLYIQICINVTLLLLINYFYAKTKHVKMYNQFKQE